jgi:hypothetical protein
MRVLEDLLVGGVTDSGQGQAPRAGYLVIRYKIPAQWAARGRG